jgi:UMF1 family MFS transporter
MEKLSASRAQLLAWAFYDWASSAFPIIVTTFVFATYFTTHVAANEIQGTYQWATATAIAGVMIAILSPIFGSIADHGGHHKRWLIFFTLLSALFTALLWFAYPQVTFIKSTLVCVVLGTICLEIAVVFYNSFLPHLAPQKYLGRISGWAWGLGYLGGIISLSIALFGFIQNPPAWLNLQTAEQVRICALLTAVWYLIFSLPLFIAVPDTESTGIKPLAAVKKGFKDLVLTLKQLSNQKNLTLYLIAHLIYADGLNTLFAFGGIYAAGTFGMDLSHVILFGITMNLSAGLGAIVLAWIDDYLGSKATILISLFFLITLGVPLLFVHETWLFWSIALTLAIFIGPVQAASRSLMARLTPLEKSTEMFGLYAFSGKITAFMGPWLLGLLTYFFHSQRAGMGSILLFFLVGALLMLKVSDKGLAK